MDIAPLLDIVFILLIFFAVSTTLKVSSKGINLTLPAATTVNEEDGSRATVSIDADGQTYLDDALIDVGELMDAVAKRHAKQPAIQFSLNADQRVPYQTIIQHMDAIRRGGVYAITLEAVMDLPTQ